MNFFRVQGKDISFQEMKEYQSTDVDGTQYNGICCTDSASSLQQYMESYFEDDNKYEVIIFEGIQTDEIYDGVVAKPVREITRMTPTTFLKNDFSDYE